jgi:hypothetical protein
MSRLLHRPFWCQKWQVSGLGKFFGSEGSSPVGTPLGGRRLSFCIEDNAALRMGILLRVEEDRRVSDLR